jgi:RNA polymerase sigma-70 factor (ECF subfamily)
MRSLVPFFSRLRLLPTASSTSTSLAHVAPPPFPELVSSHQGAVRAFLRRLTDDDALADDLAQETFLKARPALAGFRGEGSVGSWLLRIAYRQWLSNRRGRRARSEQLADVGDAHEDVVDHGSDRRTERSVERDVRRALRVLSDDERAAIAACFYDGLTHEEAAAVLEMPLGTLKSHVSRAREKLRTPLAAYAPDAATTTTTGVTP